MDLWLVAAGMAIGLAMAAPLGPVNIIVIRASLRRGMASGLAAGAGSLLADTIYATVAAYGIRQVQQFFTDYTTAITLVGGLFLVVIGIHTARAHSRSSDLDAPPPGPATTAQLWRRAFTTFGLTLSNPGALFGVFAIFGSVSPMLQLDGAYRPAVAIFGFALGGAAWWVFLSYIAAHFKHRLSPAVLDRINHWIGLAVAASGFALLLKLVL